MTKVSSLYQCDINPNDHLVTYVTGAERDGTHFALVMTNAQDHKISTLLTRDDAIRLQNELNDFILHS